MHTIYVFYVSRSGWLNILEKNMQRCDWAKNDLAIHYHDNEWGVPLHDDQRLFEFLILEGAQAGLSWDTILRKRENYRKAFDNFDAEQIVAYTDAKCAELMQNEGIIRNRLKIASVIRNAKCYLQTVEEFGTFDKYIWSFVNGKPIVNAWETHKSVPATTPTSDKLCKDLKKRGFNFVGSTIMYAFMQATGMVNDHLIDCFCYNRVAR